MDKTTNHLLPRNKHNCTVNETIVVIITFFLCDFLQVMNLSWKRYMVKAACFSYGIPCLIVSTNLVFVKIFAQPSNRPGSNGQGEFLDSYDFSNSTSIEMT